MEELVVKLVESEGEMGAAYAIRTRVFVQEQGVPYDDERDVEDEMASHAIAILGLKSVGTGRLVLCGVRKARIGRMAVEVEWRGLGIGSRILAVLEEEARRLGLLEVVFHSQTYVQAFYASHGYVEEGDVFWESGIEHVMMKKRV